MLIPFWEGVGEKKNKVDYVFCLSSVLNSQVHAMSAIQQKIWWVKRQR